MERNRTKRADLPNRPGAAGDGSGGPDLGQCQQPPGQRPFSHHAQRPGLSQDPAPGHRSGGAVHHDLGGRTQALRRAGRPCGGLCAVSGGKFRHPHPHGCASALGLAGFDAMDITPEERAALGGLAKAQYGLPVTKKLKGAVSAALATGTHGAHVRPWGGYLRINQSRP